MSILWFIYCIKLLTFKPKGAIIVCSKDEKGKFTEEQQVWNTLTI